MEKQVWIDWQSPPTHRFFNEALVGLVTVKPTILYVFSKELIHPAVKSVLVARYSGRFARALRVAGLILLHRQANILLLTYDPLFMPVFNLLARRIRVVEHNTTPEMQGQVKHVLWQKVLMRGITRLTQFPSQGRRLSELNLFHRHLGSPLLENERWSPKYVEDGVYIAPRARSFLGDLAKISELVADSPIQIKGDAEPSLQVSNLNLIDVETFDLERVENIKGIIITISSSIRGSGWFNDAIALGIPLIITNKNAQNIFEETFPNYPYIDPEKIDSFEDMEKALTRVRSFNHERYIKAHNEVVARNFDVT